MESKEPFPTSKDFTPVVVDCTELYSVRMIVLMETAPQSNVYNQVVLEHEHFKAVSKAVADGFKAKGMNNGLIIEDDVEVRLPDSVQDYAPEGTIEALEK